MTRCHSQILWDATKSPALNCGVDLFRGSAKMVNRALRASSALLTSPTGLGEGVGADLQRTNDAAPRVRAAFGAEGSKLHRVAAPDDPQIMHLSDLITLCDHAQPR